MESTILGRMRTGAGKVHTIAGQAPTLGSPWGSYVLNANDLRTLKCLGLYPH